MWPGLKTISNISIILYLTNTCKEKENVLAKPSLTWKMSFYMVMKLTNDPICSLDLDVISYLKFKLFQIIKKQNKITKKSTESMRKTTVSKLHIQISNTKLWCHNRGKNSCRKIKKKNIYKAIISALLVAHKYYKKIHCLDINDFVYWSFK